MLFLCSASFFGDKTVVVRHNLRDHLDGSGGSGSGSSRGSSGSGSDSKGCEGCGTGLAFPEVDAGKQPVSVKNGPSLVRAAFFLALKDHQLNSA